MKKTILTLGAIIVFMFVADSASARCADDLKSVKAAAADVPNANKNRRDAVKQKLDEAAMALSHRDEHGCKAAVAAAQGLIK